MSRATFTKWNSCLIAAAAMIAIACSSNPDSGNTGAAALLIGSGDGQSAAPATALPVPVAVAVHDASGAAVGGVVVSFSVDSGGGAIASASATSGADGVATAGTWTLGPAAGVNVITARASGYASVRFHAQAFGSSARPIVTGGMVPSGGGTLQYQKPGDPLSGLTVTVPAAAYSLPTQWTIVADSSVPVPLPADFTQVGPALIIANQQGYADSVMTLTMPLHVDLTMAVAPFYFDPTTGTMEGIPVVDRTDSSVTLAARHFSGDLMAIPGRAASAGVRASLRAAFGSVRIVWVQVPIAKLQGTYVSGFQSGIDNWEFQNRGDYFDPDGDCEGMSISEMYYYYYVKSAGRPSLYHHFDVSLANPWDDVQGIRFAGAVQHDYDHSWSPTVNAIASLVQRGRANGVAASTLTAQWIALTIKLTHQPVLIDLAGPGGAHAVVATTVGTVGTTATIKFSDPNYPTQARQMTFQAGVLDPVQLQQNADAPAGDFVVAYAVGVTAEVPLVNIEVEWSDFLAKRAGSQEEPNGLFEAYDSAALKWVEVQDTIRTTVSPVQLRARCELCSLFKPGSDPADMQVVHVYNDSGDTRLDDDQTPASFPANPGTDTYVAVFNAYSPFSTPAGKPGFTDSHVLTVIYHAFTLQPGKINDKVDSTYTFTASSGGVAVSTTKFVWKFGDGSDSAVVIGDSTITHRYQQPGDYTPAVVMYTSTGTVAARASSKVTVAVTVVRGIWQLTSAGSSNDLATVLHSSADQDAQLNVDRLVGSITGTPGSVLVFVVDSADCKGILAERFSGPISLSLVPGATKIALGGTCKSNPQVFMGGATIGQIGNGPLNGSVGEGAFGSAGWTAGAIPSYATSIQSLMGSGQLAGTVKWTVDYTEGAADYTLTFTASQLFPVPHPGLKASPKRKS